MAILNNLYIHCTSEDFTRDVEIVEHPVEEGFPVADHVRVGAKYLSLQGKIVDTKDMKAEDILQTILSYQEQGTYVNFSGRNVANNFLITDFSTTNTNVSGYDFSMELKEIRIAKSPFIQIDVKTGVLNQVLKYSTAEDIFHTVKKGDTIHGLVNNKYRGYGFSEDEIIKNNPDAFSKKLSNGNGDPRTLKVGAKLKMGARKQ